MFIFNVFMGHIQFKSDEDRSTFIQCSIILWMQLAICRCEI